ncbi:MAG: portal protein, partial [Geminicoccaceae bacterium]
MPDETGAATAFPEGEEDFLVCARRWYNEDYTADRDNIRNAGDDIRFYSGDQWLNEDRVAREAQNRPVITEDHLAPAVRQITNDMRMNKPALKVRGVDSASDIKVATIYEGLIRNIEQQSFASTGNAYVKGGENATICGRGAWRIITEYANESGFDQDIKIIPIRGALSVVWDSDAESPTRDDARRCWLLKWMSKESFNAAYPDKPTTNWEGHSQVSQEWYSDWNRKEEVLIAELFYKKPKTRTIWRMATDQRIVDVTDKDDEEQAELVRAEAQEAMEQGSSVPNPPYEERKIESSEVWRCVMNGGSILEPRRKWIGRYIPVINVLGEELFLNDSRTMRGLVRVGKDSQRMINYHNSAAVEHVSLSPKQPYLVTQAQIAGLERQWQISNRQNATYLTYKHDPNAPGPPSRLAAPQIPAALLTLKQEA